MSAEPLEFPEPRPRAGEARADRADGDAERERCVLVREARPRARQDHVALVLRKAREEREDVAQLARVFSRRRCGPLEREPRECRAVPAQRAARVARAVEGHPVQPRQRAVAAEADVAPLPPRLEEDRRGQILRELTVAECAARGTRTPPAHAGGTTRRRPPGRRRDPRDHSSASVRLSTLRRMSASPREFRRRPHPRPLVQSGTTASPTRTRPASPRRRPRRAAGARWSRSRAVGGEHAERVEVAHGRGRIAGRDDAAPDVPERWTTALPIRTSRPIQASSAYGSTPSTSKSMRKRRESSASTPPVRARSATDAAEMMLTLTLGPSIARRADLVRHDEPQVEPRPRRERRAPRPGDEAPGAGRPKKTVSRASPS